MNMGSRKVYLDIMFLFELDHAVESLADEKVNENHVKLKGRDRVLLEG